MIRRARRIAVVLCMAALPAPTLADAPVQREVAGEQALVLRMDSLLRATETGDDAIALVGIAGIDQPCPGGSRSGPIDLAEAVTRALCTNPRTRQSWAAARAQAAQVGIERAGYLPRLSAFVEEGRGRSRLTEKVQVIGEDAAEDVGEPVDDEEEEEEGEADGVETLATAAVPREKKVVTRSEGRFTSAGLEFTWLLFDFGQRAAAVESAHQTLLAATATHDATVQEVFLEAGNAYYELLAAQSAADAAREIEEFALRTLADAEALAAGKGGEEMDADERLQARSSVAQSALDRVRAEGELRAARGNLAVLLGLSPDAAISANADEVDSPNHRELAAIASLLEQARLAHPAIRAAQARVAAARANLDAAGRLYRPTLSLVGGRRREHDTEDSKLWDNRIALQLDIPLFDRAHHHQQRLAAAELDGARAEVLEAEQQVALSVWSAYQALQTESAALEHIEALLLVSLQLLKQEQELYRSSDGDLTDLIIAQQTVAAASLDRVQTLANWRAARLQLAAGLGRLGFWNIRKPAAAQRPQ